MPATSVAPRYSMATASTVDDRPTANTTRVSGATYGSPASPVIPLAAGLATSATSDMGGMDLKAQTAYNDPAGLLRPTASYQPGAALGTSAGTDYGWWAPSDTSAGTCSGAPAVKQAGALKTLTLPDQGGGARRVESYVYDWAGRDGRERHRRRQHAA